MVSLIPNMMVFLKGGKDSGLDKKSGVEKKVDKRTHLERIVDTLKSSQPIEALSVDYNGQVKSLQQYIAEDVFESSEHEARMLVAYPDQQMYEQNRACLDRLNAYFWGGRDSFWFINALVCSTRLANTTRNRIHSSEDYAQLHYSARNLSESLLSVTKCRIYTGYPECAELRKLQQDLESNIRGLKDTFGSMPKTSFFDLFTNRGLDRILQKRDVEQALGQESYALLHDAIGAKTKLSSLGDKLRHDYVVANPKQMALQFD